MFFALKIKAEGRVGGSREWLEDQGDDRRMAGGGQSYFPLPPAQVGGKPRCPDSWMVLVDWNSKRSERWSFWASTEWNFVSGVQGCTQGGHHKNWIDEVHMGIFYGDFKFNFQVKKWLFILKMHSSYSSHPSLLILRHFRENIFSWTYSVTLRVLSGFEYRFFAHPIYALLISLKFEYQYINILVKGWSFSLMCFLRQKCFNLENIQGVPKKKICKTIQDPGAKILFQNFSVIFYKFLK